MAHHRGIELAHAGLAVRILRGIHFLEHERVTANGALTKDDQVARQDIGALDGDGDRHDLVAAPEIIVRPQHNALAAMNIHCIIGDHAADFGGVILEHGGGHRGLFAAVDGTRGHRARSIDDVGACRHARQNLFNALEAADRRVELAADARIGARCIDGGLRTAGGIRGQ